MAAVSRSISHPPRVDRSRGLAAALLAGLLVFSGAAAAETAPPPDRPIATAPRGVSVILPLKDGTAYLGDVTTTITADGEARLPGKRFLDLLGPMIQPVTLKAVESRLQGHDPFAPGDIKGTGVAVVYDAQKLELALAIDPAIRRTADLSLAGGAGQNTLGVERPAKFSMYTTASASVDIVEKSTTQPTGLASPKILLESAVRLKGVVLESFEDWEPYGTKPFARLATRLVYDDVKHVNRWMLGDLNVETDGFQFGPTAAGIGVEHSYELLEPTRLSRPSGAKSFLLAQASNVTIYVNGQVARRLRLEPGNYNLSNFPFTQGANQVRVTADAGQGDVEILKYRSFYEQEQLQSGLSEYGLFVGVKSHDAFAVGPRYTDQWVASGFFKRGLSDLFTIDVNGQADAKTAMVGLGGIWSTPIGVVGFRTAGSHAQGYGWGWAAGVTLRRTFAGVASFEASIETLSKQFAPLDAIPPNNPFKYDALLTVSRTFSDRFYGSITLDYAPHRKGAAVVPNSQEGYQTDYQLDVGYYLTPKLLIEFNASYQKGVTNAGPAGFLTITWHPRGRASLRAEYDSRQGRGDLTYQNYGGQDAGSWTIDASVEQTGAGGEFNGEATYDANRVKLGIDQNTSWDFDQRKITDQRTSLRAAASIAFADGAFAIGRPVVTSFAVVTRHESLKDAVTTVEPNDHGYLAKSDWLGSALAPELTAYVPRNLTVDLAKAPPGYDFGAGAFKVYPPYHGGYRLMVGSDYSLTAIGELKDQDGKPLVFATGTAEEVGGPKREPQTIFTNRQGRFAASALRPGRWRLKMNSDPPLVYEFVVPKGKTEIIKLGPLAPVEVK
jgi:outer membrane usher protein